MCQTASSMVRMEKRCSHAKPTTPEWVTLLCSRLLISTPMRRWPHSRVWWKTAWFHTSTKAACGLSTPTTYRGRWRLGKSTLWRATGIGSSGRMMWWSALWRKNMKSMPIVLPVWFTVADNTHSRKGNSILHGWNIRTFMRVRHWRTTCFLSVHLKFSTTWATNWALKANMVRWRKTWKMSSTRHCGTNSCTIISSTPMFTPAQSSRQ